MSTTTAGCLDTQKSDRTEGEIAGFPLFSCAKIGPGRTRKADGQQGSGQRRRDKGRHAPLTGTAFFSVQPALEKPAAENPALENPAQLNKEKTKYESTKYGFHSFPFPPPRLRRRGSKGRERKRRAYGAAAVPPYLPCAFDPMGTGIAVFYASFHFAAPGVSNVPWLFPL